ncbi:hypothetical protein NRIC_35530 [Enterococcus florum]|uniref:Uncharacterized protein n=1 Tax=Enterococcus florum TaxID=2480627 RepID=A0A4P5PJ96_9ENTE|nr:hypothetical protein NRIC_35530 [Enterococcus florum]
MNTIKKNAKRNWKTKVIKKLVERSYMENRICVIAGFYEPVNPKFKRKASK